QRVVGGGRPPEHRLRPPHRLPEVRRGVVGKSPYAVTTIGAAPCRPSAFRR
ncbi:hypothetical protein A2U01_0061101, partial [Trifolium medium]|nr:hypothetical protein [Trifolium medium]